MMKHNPITLAIRTSLLCSLILPNMANADEQAIERIMVTGQKIDRTLQETTASVAVITSKQIEDQNINDFYDALERTPNVNGDLRNGFSIRGIDAYNVSGGGSSNLASLYIDGAVMPYDVIRQGGFSTWDVSQIEILRGPQSTLQGRNSLAGAIIMRTVDPSFEWQGKARLGVGEYGQREYAAAIGGEVIEDEVAFRASADKNDFDGYIDNTFTGVPADHNNNETYRIKLKYQPSNLQEFYAQVGYTKSKTNLGIRGTSTLAADGSQLTDPFSHREVSLDLASFTFTDVDIYTLELNYDINDNLTASAVSTYSTVDAGFSWDDDGTSEPTAARFWDNQDDTFSQEVKFVIDTDKLSGVVGAFYSNQETETKSHGQRYLSFQRLGVPTLLVTPPEHGGLGLPQPLADRVLDLYADVDPVRIYNEAITKQSVTNLAMFADAVYEINDNWDIFAGFRFDREKQDNEADGDVAITNAHLMPDPSNPAFDPMTSALITGINAKLLGMADSASGVEPLVDASFNAFLPKLGASYHWSSDITTSFTVQQGYRSGGVGTNTAQNTTHTFDPEYTWNYELAFRSVWLAGSLSANANIFYVDWQDQQVDVQFSGNRYDSETRNAGSSTVQGFEAELFYQIDSDWSIYGGVGYAKTEFEEFKIVLPTVTYDLSGRSFEDAPEWTANLGSTYRSDSGIFANLNVSYAGESSGINNPEAAGLDYDPMNDERILVNARVGYEWDHFSIYALGTNIFDNEYVSLVDVGYDFQTLSSPRQLTLRVEAQF
ncbi:TonB-dependent receptor [Shewanella sp. YLB-09]|uniref:TonB-dependent receptor n=2 Tax=Shewanella TaxID=22 RepID=UPI001E58DE0E|nr:TonB-dependent receptor [Shewanella sp. YLB-09]